MPLISSKVPSYRASNCRQALSPGSMVMGVSLLVPLASVTTSFIQNSLLLFITEQLDERLFCFSLLCFLLFLLCFFFFFCRCLQRTEFSSWSPSMLLPLLTFLDPSFDFCRCFFLLFFLLFVDGGWESPLISESES